MSQAFGYIALAEIEKTDKTKTLFAQKNRIELYAENNLENKCDGISEFVVEKLFVHGDELKFTDRQSVKDLFRKCKAGDHIIVDSLSRVYRHINDMALIIQAMKDHCVFLHIIDVGGQPETIYPDRTSDIERILLSVVDSNRVFAVESGSFRSNKKVKLQTSYLATGSNPPGTIIKSSSGRTKTRSRFLEWDPVMRLFMSEIVRIRDDERLLGEKMHKAIQVAEKKIYNKKPGEIRAYTTEKWGILYKWEVAYRYLQIEDPAMIPPRNIINEAARQHKREITEKRLIELGTKHGSSNSRSAIEKISREELLGLI